MLLFYSFLLTTSILASGYGIPHVRIIGGLDTTIERNPWQVSLHILGRFVCGGTIISESVVISAAHCINIDLVGVTEVLVGTASLQKGGERISVREVIIHEEYDGNSYDAALLFLTKVLTFGETIAPARLPTEEVAVGTTVRITGWGATDPWNHNFSPILKLINIKITDRKICAQSYVDIPNAVIDSTVICANDPDHAKDICTGDSGGPLTVNGILYGIVSWGIACNNPDYPGIYTNVPSIRAWIKNKSGV